MSYFYQLFQHFVSWLLDPASLIDAAGSMLLSLFAAMTGIFDSDLAAELIKVQTYCDSGIFGKMLCLVAYVFSPFCDPVIFMACVKVGIDVWLITALISLGFMVKGWITGTGA